MDNKGEEKIRSGELKKAGRRCLKDHYLILVVICFLSALLGAEFSGSLEPVRSVLHKSTTVQERETELYEKEDGTMASRGVIVELDASSVLLKCLKDGVDAGSSLSEQLNDQMIANATNPSLGRTRGVLSELVNRVSSGALWITMISALRNLIHSDTLISVLLILMSIFLYLLYWFFIRNCYKAASRRMFLEARLYSYVPYYRLLHFLRVRRWIKASLTMALTSIFEALWSLTIIGGMIKHYSYFLVPYIVAENPDIAPREAIRLSRRMMYGHKMDCFVKELSFLGWILPGVLTLGVSDILYTSPYKTAAFTEYYAYLRGLAKAKELEGTDKLNDVWLYDKAPFVTVRKAYRRELEELRSLKEIQPQKNKVLRFLAKWFGLILYPSAGEQAYEEQQMRREYLLESSKSLEGEAYPMRLSPFPEEKRSRHIEGIYYDRNYTLAAIGFFFLFFSIFGWVWEGTMHLIEKGVFVNRGIMHGPWIPIYGTGVVLAMLLLKRLRSNPVAHFLATVGLCGIVEYMTGYVMEMTHGGERWWDYSGYFLNLDGRICAEGLFVFGVGGSLIIYLIAPLLDNLVRQIPHKIFAGSVLIVLLIFLCDNIYSVKHPNMGAGVTSLSYPTGAAAAAAAEEQTEANSDLLPED